MRSAIYYTRNKEMVDKKMTSYEIMSAIATAVYQTSNFLDTKQNNTYEKEDHESRTHWKCWEEPISAVKCKFRDNKLVVMFSVETINPLKLDNHYENKINAQMEDIISGIKKKYKEITDKTLGLKTASDIYEQSIPLSHKRQIRVYTCLYTIDGIESVEEQDKKDVKELLKTAIDKADEMTVFKRKRV